MRVVLSLLSLSAVAVGAAAGFVLFPDAADYKLAEVAAIDDRGRARLSAPPAEQPPSAQTTEPRFFGSGISAVDKSAPIPQAVAPASTPLPSQPWQTDVTLAARSPATPRSEPTPASQLVVTTGSLPARRELTADNLARDLQRELRRVGCYHADVDGAWGPGSQRAISAFLQRVNSTLPTDKPDLVQLTLVRGFSGQACGPERGVLTASTSRQSPVEPSRALPLAPAPQLAVRSLQPQAPPSVVPPVAVAAPVPVGNPAAFAASAASQQPQGYPPVVIFEGRMAIGGPRNEDPPGIHASGPLTGADAITQPRRVTRAPPPRNYASPRRDRSWTATFFNQ